MASETAPSTTGLLEERVAAIVTMAALKGVTPRRHTVLEGLALHAGSIDQKFGFDDGAIPDPLWDLMGDYGFKGPLGVMGWWDAALWAMVTTHLVPAIDSHIEAHSGDPLPPLMLSAYTSHNPIRFARNTDTASTLDNLDDVVLPDVTVVVPWLDVLAHTIIAIEDARAAKAAASART